MALIMEEEKRFDTNTNRLWEIVDNYDPVQDVISHIDRTTTMTFRGDERVLRINRSLFLRVNIKKGLVTTYGRPGETFLPIEINFNRFKSGKIYRTINDVGLSFLRSGKESINTYLLEDLNAALKSYITKKFKQAYLEYTRLVTEQQLPEPVDPVYQHEVQLPEVLFEDYQEDHFIRLIFDKHNTSRFWSEQLQMLMADYMRKCIETGHINTLSTSMLTEILPVFHAKYQDCEQLIAHTVNEMIEKDHPGLNPFIKEVFALINPRRLSYLGIASSGRQIIKSP